MWFDLCAWRHISISKSCQGITHPKGHFCLLVDLVDKPFATSSKMATKQPLGDFHLIFVLRPLLVNSPLHSVILPSCWFIPRGPSFAQTSPGLLTAPFTEERSGGDKAVHSCRVTLHQPELLKYFKRFKTDLSKQHILPVPRVHLVLAKDASLTGFRRSQSQHCQQHWRCASLPLLTGLALNCRTPLKEFIFLRHTQLNSWLHCLDHQPGGQVVIVGMVSALWLLVQK